MRKKKTSRPRIYSTTNPGGVGHSWYRKKFIEPFLSGSETETRFIPAKAGDNSFNNPEYARVLQNLTGWQKRAWADGDWDIAAGQYFTTFRREVHVLKVNVDEDGNGGDDFADAFRYLIQSKGRQVTQRKSMGL